ncbi:zinc finger 653 [Pelobates cultripes]|uniref:Zinc finger protein 653 n=1 Tax=Pelobates cultripes TaxID=61616 RepID=A0AAD1RJJ0_PELCU|nr:zinc finger 653 [Pelobates cultripes]
MAAPVEEEEMKVRGRPRLTDTDRARRRLESRKKYDCRRVYLGEAHGAWVLRREQGGHGELWSDAKLAAYLLGLERHGKPIEDIPESEQQKKRKRGCLNSLISLVTWYQDHSSHCSHEPSLSELDTSHFLYVTAVWQCQAGHHFFQDLQCPLKKLNQQGFDDGVSSDDSSTGSPLVEHTSNTCPSTEQTVHTLYPHSSENLNGDETQCADESETVVCVPMGPVTEELFEGVTQETLGQVVAASCPSQVIIIAGPGYEALTAEGIQLDVTGGSAGEEGTCTTLEAMSAYTQTEIMDPEMEQHMADTVTEEDPLYGLQRMEPESQGECDGDLVQSQSEPLSTEVQEYGTNSTQAVPKEPEKRKSRRCRALDGDGVLEMFHCPYEGCTQVYTALNSFQNHVNLVHRKGKTKVCPEPGCGKRFYLSNHLRRHMIIHTGVREFICETCGKSFKRKSHLEVHRRTHTGETPLQCEVCGFQCRQRASLNWHMKKHQAEVQYSFSCEHCGKLFEKQDSVKFHKLKSHPEGRTT